ncbi:hypothetical protein [uncultured Bacteroides sp.]|uniref:hypothetical protein n=1 Tax=uncultured Bacteroides sp. TaxID=162156 RepID=UPI002AA8D533|nr:hypothetical protein [uncultured Bacteroides sp.]
MEFITSNINKTGTLISSLSTGSGGGGTYTVPSYLSLSTSTDIIINGIAKKYTNINGTHGGVTDLTANYLISSSTGNTNNGWIFQHYNTTSGTAKNVASIDNSGNLTVDGYIDCNLIDCGNW